jgi:hypothetical protein
MDDSRSTLRAGVLHPGPGGLDNDGWTAVQEAVVVPSVDGEQPGDEAHAAHTLSGPHKENTSWVVRSGAPYWEA